MAALSLTPQQLAELCRQKTVQVLDVRTPAEFGEVHIPHATNSPLDKLDPAKVLNGCAGDEPIYLICKSGSRGKQACEKFLKAGFANAINVDGGTQAWIDAGLPVVRGKKAMSLEQQVRIAAGSLVVIGIGLGLLVHPVLFGLAGFVGAGLVFAGLSDTCGMGMVLARMPWNQSTATCSIPKSQ